MRQKGFAIPVTLVALALALVVLMAATSQLVLASLRGRQGRCGATGPWPWRKAPWTPSPS